MIDKPQTPEEHEFVMMMVLTLKAMLKNAHQLPDNSKSAIEKDK